MFPIIDKPVMQLLVEEAVEAWCTDIIIVTGRSKRAIEDHFDANIELEHKLEESHKDEFLEAVKKVNSLANIIYIRQPYPKGDWDAILRAKTIIWDEAFLVLFWDDIIDNWNWKNAASQLVEAYHRKNNPVIATIPVKDKEVSSYWIIEEKFKEDKIFSVSRFLEKPKPEETKSRNWVIGKYVLTPEIFNYLEKANPWKSDWEIRLADAFELMRKQKDIYWVQIEWERFDTGSKIWFIKAIISFALKRDDLKDEVNKYLNKICKK
jgi:UTP--glucose-1-phosphate uridylyltransferase